MNITQEVLFFPPIRFSTCCDALGCVLRLEAEDLGDTVVAGRHLDLEGHGRAARETVVLGEVDLLAGELLHLERPEEAGDGQEDLLLGKRDTRADTAAGKDGLI